MIVATGKMIFVIFLVLLNHRRVSEGRQGKRKGGLVFCAYSVRFKAAI